MHFEVNCIPGTSNIVRSELERVVDSVKITSQKKSAIIIGRRADVSQLLTLKTTPEVFKVLPFNIPRPKALLGSENYSKLVTCAKGVLNDSFKSFRIEAAGSDSSVFNRLAAELEKSLGIPFIAQRGDLKIIVRKGLTEEAWEVLFRISARPLSLRPWRQKNFRGALDACVANCLLQKLDLQSKTTFCNLMLGSGTLVAEAYCLNPNLSFSGVEIDPAVLEMAKENLQGIAGRFIEGDAQRTDFESGTQDLVVANLPWGEAVSTKGELYALYENVINETKRLLSKDSTACFVTQRADVLEQVLSKQSDLEISDSFQVKLKRGFSPIIYTITN